ncbi:MAG: hypothetical protein B6I20_06095 [Bacteroidetes bacterium 4572_117]|nr:MAG: hypothetical protein B6I20_06095 [Bacteroidetes bacterium 4572_117]
MRLRYNADFMHIISLQFKLLILSIFLENLIEIALEVGKTRFGIINMVTDMELLLLPKAQEYKIP